LRQAFASMPRAHAVEVLLKTDLKTASKHFFEAMGVFEQCEDGVLLRSNTDSMDWFAGHLAGLPFDFEVRSPEALRTTLVRLGQRLQALAAR
jgi:predicted DNA-binding transcriptional regulator YafY